jgi:glutaminyl-tRNA synthetase
LSAEEMREYRGTLTEPGRNSPYRDRTPEENLDLFRRMRGGEFPDGAKALRAKIDMNSGNINLRDPVLYRILRSPHPRTGDTWCLYPTYDFAHGQTDALEGITHSLCTLEFEDHRPLYDWLLDNLPVPSRPHQYEFSRLNLTHTVLSKRLLTQLVAQQHVAGWDDPRLPTLAGMRRRGIPPAAVRDFIGRLAISKSDSVVEAAMLDHCIREHLNSSAERRMAVLRPLKIVIENYPEDAEEELEAVNHPGDPDRGTRMVPFSREIYVERDDFMEDPPRKFFRLGPGREVRLRFAYFITCIDVIKDSTGTVTELRCTYDPATKGGDAPDGRKVRGTIHWVSAKHAITAEVRLYDTLFSHETPGTDGNLVDHLNPDSLDILTGCQLEPSLGQISGDDTVQFERLGYFCRDTEATDQMPIFNRTIGLRDSWAKTKAKS